MNDEPIVVRRRDEVMAKFDLLKLRLWRWWHRCDCTYGAVLSSFEDDPVACRLGFHPEGCPGLHVSVTPCPRHGPNPSRSDGTP